MNNEIAMRAPTQGVPVRYESIIEQTGSQSRGHQWEGMVEYKLSAEQYMDWLNSGSKGRMRILNKMPENHYFQVNMSLIVDNGARRLDDVVKGLQKEGMDIGKGEREFGFKMPLPTKIDKYRTLRIFRRSKK